MRSMLNVAADVLTFADERGIHSHGAMRVEYYAERIAKGGINTNPDFKFEKTGPASGVFHGDGGNGHTAAKLAMDEAIKMAKESGVAIIGVRDISHSGAISYFTNQAAVSGFNWHYCLPIGSDGCSVWRCGALLWNKSDCLCCTKQ